MRAKMSPVVTTLAREHCCVATINEQGSRTPQPPNPNPNPNSNPRPRPSPHSPSFSDCLRRGVRNQVCCGVRDLGRLSLQTLLFYHGTRTTRWLSFERLCLPGLLLPPFNTNVDRPCVTFFTYSSRRGGGGQRCVTVNVDCGRHRPRPWLSARRR